MTKSNKQKSHFKRILCGCLSILLLPYHWLYAWFLWTERQREEAESSSNHSSLYDNDIFSEKTSRKAGHNLYDPNDLTNYSNPLSPFFQGHNSTNAPLKEMEETIDPTSLSSINNPDSLYYTEFGIIGVIHKNQLSTILTEPPHQSSTPHNFLWITFLEFCTTLSHSVSSVLL